MSNPQPPPSPMHPVAPPTKKQRSIQPPMRGGRDALSTAADDAIARRRAELRRLQEKRTQQQGGSLVDQARTQLGGPPMPQPQQHVARARHSDIFPHVTKSVAPPPSTQKQTPQVARRLDPSFDEKKVRSQSAPPMRPPPPPVPPPLVAEAPPERKSPAAQSLTPTTPSTIRRDTLRNLREMVPDSQNVQLVKELKIVQEEKAEALRKVARLKEQIQQLQKPQQQSSPQQQSVSQVAFLSPLHASATPRRGSRSASSPALLGTSTRKRVPTPHPKRQQQDYNDNEFLKQASESIPYEYSSALATYSVRRPYGLDSEELWTTAKLPLPYQPDVSKPSTLQVAATISADGSILTLSDASTVRHKNTNEWKVYEDVDDMDKPLGCVMYIDSDANEKEYWLDAIYEEVFATREAYCASLISAAALLQANKAQSPTSPAFPQTTMSSITRPSVADACVGTEDLQVNEKEKSSAPTVAKPSTETAKPPPKELVEETSSGDVLSSILGMIFSSLLGLVWLVLVRIPFKIFTFSLLLVVASGFLSIIWLYLADDHGAQLMGAGVQYGFNKPSIV